MQQSALHIAHAVESAAMPPMMVIPKPSLRRTASKNAAAEAERQRQPQMMARGESALLKLPPLPPPRRIDRSVSCDESQLKSLQGNNQVGIGAGSGNTVMPGY